MSIKKIYHSLKQKLEFLPVKLVILVTSLDEDRAILAKRKIYKNIRWTKEQKKQFDFFWQQAYGKRISDKWHRLYQACSGEFAVDYIPEKLYSTKIEPKMNDALYAKALEDKSMVELLSHNCKCVVPSTLLLCSDAQFYNEHRIPISKKQAIQSLVNRRFIVKPTVGTSSGKGITILDSKETNNEDFLNRVLDEQGKDFIVQAVINPHPVFATLNQSSINTIRITTFLINNVIHHAPLALRIGRSGKCVDNIHAGGLVVGVSEDGYLLSDAFELGYGDKTKRFSKHPDSGVIFSGYKLPCIDRIIESAHMMHGRYPHIGIISWDYTVNEDSMPVLIEANIMGQSAWIVQMIHGKGLFGEHTKDILERIRV